MYKTFITIIALCATVSAFAAVERIWTPAITTAKPFKGTVTKYDGANVTLEVTQTITFHKSRLSRLDQEWLRANAAKLKCGASTTTCGTTTTTCTDTRTDSGSTCDPTTGNCEPADDTTADSPCEPASGESPPATDTKKESAVAAQFAGLTSVLKGDKFEKKDVKPSAKFYLLLFSASGCPPCRESMPKVIAEYKKIQEDPDYEIIHISEDTLGSAALSWAKSLANPIPVLLPLAKQPTVCKLNTYGGIPHILIVTAEGKKVTNGHPTELLPSYKKTCTDYANKNK